MHLVTLDDQRGKPGLVALTAQQVWVSYFTWVTKNYSHRRIMKASRICRSALVLAVAGLTIGITACSSGSSSTGTGNVSSGSGSKPELSTITVGVLPSADSVTLQIAQDKGFFAQQGLNVKTIIEKTTNDGTTGLLSHTMDFTAENYVGMFSAEKLVPNLNLRIVADNSQASTDNYVLLVPKNSKLTSISQLKGKKVAFPAPGFNFGAMALDVLLAPYHMSSASFTTVVLPFSDAAQALAKGEVDAAFTTEPFITTAEAAAGDRILVDMMSGPLVGEPEACWGTNQYFVQKYPKTVAAFQRAMTAALQVAATNPSYVRSELPKFIPTMKPAIAKVITLPTYNTTLSLTRMERVADTMERLNALPKNFDVKSMYYPMAGAES
jgi:NitT/TauT family transport system substrate-binding protein